LPPESLGVTNSLISNLTTLLTAVLLTRYTTESFDLSQEVWGAIVAGSMECIKVSRFRMLMNVILTGTQ